MQVVGGDGLVLLLHEAESREGEFGTLADAVLMHGGERIPIAGCEQVEEAGVARKRGD